VNKLIKWGVLAAFAGSAGTVYADTAETKGGLKVKTDDGRFEMTIGGRIHLDFNLVDNDTSATFGSNSLNNNSTAYFRRARLSFAGKAYGWEYLFVPDFAQSAGGNLPTAATVNTGDGNAVCEATPCTISVGSTSAIAFQELYVARGLFGGKLFLGQFKPFRAIEELTSSNEITFMERPWTTATGMYGGGINRQFTIGAGWQTNFMENLMFSTSVYNLRRDNTGATEGVGTATRVTFAPLMKERSTLHLGLSYSVDNPHGNNVGISIPYAGRRGPSASLNTTANSKEAQYIGAEVAGVFGPFYFQGEYVDGSFESNASDTSATAYHIQASYNVTGEVKPYDNKKAVFKNIKPNASWGAVELKARYDFAENDDATVLTDAKEVNTITVGANYYVNPNVRFMLDYIMGEAERVNGETDEPDVVAGRVQMNW
jgi:phosphate-selective porin OprO/OprP